MPSATARTRPSTRRQTRNRERRIERFQQGLTAWLRTGRLPALLVTGGCVFLLYGFLFSGDFLVGSVVVHGTRLGNPADIVTTADAIGEPIFSIDASTAAERVAALPYVEHATVRARFPDEVIISVIERTPVVTWKVGSRSFLVDAYGHVLLERSTSDLPSVIVEGDAPAVGSEVPPEQISAAVAVHEAPGNGVEEVRWSKRNGLVTRLTDNRVVIFGDAERIPVKLAAYTAITTQIDAWTLLDLREPDRPYYK